MKNLSCIKAIITDVDGVLTNGEIIYDNQGNELKIFNVKDGFIVKPMQRLGFLVGVITGRNSKAVQFRCQELGFDFHFHGSVHKIEFYEEIKKKYRLSDEQICYIGDDFPDKAILIRCGLAVVPADASEAIKPFAHYVTSAQGGKGVLREVCEFILKAQNLWEAFLELY
ncbi:MAG: HAD-IIIA family hydrolase [Cytophagales bacterium]|nr:HAD-IIIA family hydrolase [Cytophagales bacterium]MDW8383416.1 HAD-IIIA family hydrolase [Flammeovirgaceae bacterium]